jgi:hypothetical protein
MNLCKLFLSALLLVMIGLIGSAPAQAQEVALSDSAYISLITVSPGEEVYAHYGHTAIRVCDPFKGFDLAFNWGIFDFNSPNFIYRFVRGQTDYLCAANSYSDFLIEYQMSNRGVTEQVLNLKQAEKERIWQALVKNIQPENRTYRYNFFFNNCSTKPRDVIVAGVDGKVEFRWKGKYSTLREEVHHFTEQHPWTQFGIDFLIGAEADEAASLRDQQFAPALLEESFDQAVIVDDSSDVRPLVVENRQPVSIDPTQLEAKGNGPKPVLVCWILFVLLAAVTVYEFIKVKHFQAITAVVYGLLGLSGSIIAFLVLFSEHPATHVNFLLLWQNPFHLIYAFGMIFGGFRKKVGAPYLAINLILQVLAVAGLFMLPQQMHPAMLPLLLMVLMRSILGTRQHIRKKKTTV